MVSIVHPVTPELIKRRNRLLTDALRPEDSPFPIEDEYPIVLHNSNLSYCLTENDNVIAHANLWPRTLTDPNTQLKYKIGLIGNVATDPSWRGKGIMTKLFQHLEDIAQDQDLSALILWSDLPSFYQKLGFVARGRELRFHLRFNDKLRQWKYQRKILPIDPTTLSDREFEKLLSLRYSNGPQIQRSTKEFRDLFHIPAMNLLVSFEADEMISYSLSGKGCDMIGVIHEWGSNEPTELIGHAKVLLETLPIEEYLLLAPGHLRPSIKQHWESYSAYVEEHSMAFIKQLSDSTSLSQTLDQLFIWGLDSI